ncbi:MAG: HEPN domain-containing protein [Peptococcaceae bacterium]|jgi:HEPN domain-containing protein|nr:HEPN domain-containing protein [Peptococcaceae bacterium]
MNKTDLAREWFEIAETDLHTAAYLFENMHPRPLEIICYHCQQSVEKALKGFLINNETEPPKIHDLEKLCQMCAKFNLSFETIRETCRKLTDYAASTRYPSLVEIEKVDAVFALREAERVYTFCADLIPELRLSDQEPDNEAPSN